MRSKKKLFINTFDYIDAIDAFINIFIGGRGIGKTYSTLNELIERGIIFMYARRTESELEKCCNDYGNPFKKLNKDKGRNTHLKSVAKIVGIYNDEEELIGYGSSLSTFGNLRGADFEDVDYIVLDEFINTSNRRTLKNEFFALCNMIETINRNRELLGQKPIKVILLSNSNSINDDIIRSLKLGEIIKRIKQTDGHGEYIDEERGIYLNVLETPPDYYDAKEATRLYKLTQGTTFHEMALDNNFVDDYFDDVKRVDYRELLPICSYDNCYVYKHKSKRLIYVCTRKANAQAYDKLTHNLFLKHYGLSIKIHMERGLILYSDYDVKLDFQSIFN